MAPKIQFMQDVCGRLVPTKRLSSKIMGKLDPELRHYVSSLRRASRCNPLERRKLSNLGTNLNLKGLV